MLLTSFAFHSCLDLFHLKYSINHITIENATHQVNIIQETESRRTGWAPSSKLLGGGDRVQDNVPKTRSIDSCKCKMEKSHIYNSNEEKDYSIGGDQRKALGGIWQESL